jgi:hypothetical protein
VMLHGREEISIGFRERLVHQLVAKLHSLRAP